MQPSARIAAVIELLDGLFASWKDARRIPADKHFDQYFRARRYIGSKDRGAVAELAYWILRHKATLEWWAETEPMPLTARTLAITALLIRDNTAAEEFSTLFNANKHAAPALTEREWHYVHRVVKAPKKPYPPEMPPHARLNHPLWLEPRFWETFGENWEKEVEALNAEAQVDLRVNTLKATREQLIERLKKEGFDCGPTKYSPLCVRLKKREAIFNSPAFKEGWFEMQDEASQAVAQLVDAKPGMRVIDFCAGAGGKTLAIAAQMNNKGKLLALDVSEKRLKQLPLRLKRAGVDNTEIHTITSETDKFLKRHKATADRVLVDAPCSGTGTWRRNPDLKWRFSAQDLQEVMALQKKILEAAARLVKPGGRVIYATCSLLKDENERVIEDFLQHQKNFRVVSAEKIWNKSSTTEADHKESASYLGFTPRQDGVDGFFAAVLEHTQ